MIDLLPFGRKAHKFIFRPYQNDARINILHGAVRSSKTAAMIPKLLLQILPNAPAGVGLFTGVSKDTIHDNVLRDLFEFIGEGNYDYNRQNGDLWLLNRQCKVVGAKDEGSEKYIRGKTVPWAYGDEVALMPESFFKQLLNRMSPEGSKFYGTTNPDDPLHYLYTGYIANPELLSSGVVRSIHFGLDDNPNLSEEYKAFIRQAYTGVFYERFILGLWVVAEGAIYKDCYTNQYNDLKFNDSQAPHKFQQRWIGVDYGTANPTVFLDGWFDGAMLWIMREYYWDSIKEGRQKTDGEYADDLLEFIGDRRGVQIIIDPSAASFKLEVKKRGLMAIEAENDLLDIENANNIVIQGIRFTSQMFGLKRIRIHESCKYTDRELRSYVWDKKKTEKGKEQPMKKNDHGPDAVRYLCFTKMVKAVNWGSLI